MYSKFLELEQEKKERIINAALKEFAQKGFEDASTNEIIKNAGISKGLLFHYFGTKLDFFLFLYDYASKIFLDEFFGLINLNERDVLARWHQLSLLKFDLIRKYPDLFHFIIAANLKQSEKIKKEMESRNSNIFAIGYGKLFEGIDESKFRNDIEIKKALDIIKWTMDGFANAEQQKMRTAELNEKDYDRLLCELDSILALFRKCFYQ